MTRLSDRELERYGRQMILPDWGTATQERLRGSRAFVAGAGGLGGPACLFLGAAGIGTLRICDFDKLELSNLNRQIIHDELRVGMVKSESARITLSKLNPDVVVEPITERLEEDNLDEVIGEADVVVDCLDNFETRHLLNSWCLRSGVPLVHAGIWGLEGRVTFIHPPETPCLACLFPEAPPQEVFPVLGATPGVIGTIQAMEAIKFLAGTGRNLKGRMLSCDFSEMTFREFPVRRDPACSVCSL